MAYEISYKTDIKTDSNLVVIPSFDDYSKMLDQYQLQYTTSGAYLQIGEVPQMQGWVLHISIVRSQINLLFNTLVPVLAIQGTPFKIVPDKETAKSLLNGNLGTESVGKVVTIFPNSPENAAILARQLVKLTDKFKGPDVPTSVHLGGTVYTRYERFHSMVYVDGVSRNSKRVQDKLSQIPSDVAWPFGDLASPNPNRPKKVFHEKYRPVIFLKLDAKGNVIKSLYIKNIFRLKWCVIKEGKKNMWSDDAGRDMPDRLLWQYELHKRFADILPIPKILDLFTENEDTYLVMDYIKGQPLVSYTYNHNKYCKCWYDLSSKDQLQVLDFILQIIDILAKLHAHGFVHRDITPVNFLVDRRHKLFIIDNELAYSIYDQRPTPPFEAGTYGFMSPEQFEQQTPTLEEDIYGLGASMIVLLTGLSPLAFCTKDSRQLQNNLFFFTNNRSISSIIAACLNQVASGRPQLTEIKEKIRTYENSIRLTQKRKLIHSIKSEKIDAEMIKEIIQQAIRGLVLEPTVIKDDLWYSKASEKKSGAEKEETGFIKRTGLFEGIPGVLYLLGRANRMGFDISSCKNAYNKGWEFITVFYSQFLPNATPGIHTGSAGIAVALAAGLEGGIISDTHDARLLIRQYLQPAPAGLDFADGLAGQAVSLLQCSRYIDEAVFKQLLTNYIGSLTSMQNKNGLWLTAGNKYHVRQAVMSFANGDPGIIWFLLQYISFANDNSVKSVIIKALNGIERSAKMLKGILHKQPYRNLAHESPAVLRDFQGHILIFIKAYEILKNPHYKDVALELLKEYPDTIVHDDFSQETGLSGLGELYLEAYLSLNNSEWLQRAEWIAEFFMHTAHKMDGGYCYWLGNNSRYPTADLMSGTSGIIHFLLRYLNSDRLGYRMLQ